LAAISRERPGLKLGTWIGRTPKLVEAVRNEKYDLAIVDASTIINPGALAVEHLANLIGGFIVRREHPPSAKSTCDLSEIREYPVACSPISDELARRMVGTFGPAGHLTQLFTYFLRQLSHPSRVGPEQRHGRHEHIGGHAHGTRPRRTGTT
jgi:hypothetical protein